jgi:hypothetical protein
LFHLFRSNLDLLRSGFLDLERLVDQVAQDLKAQPLPLFVGKLAAIGRDDERQPLPLTIAVAVRTLGSRLPKTVMSFGRLRPPDISGSSPDTV